MDLKEFVKKVIIDLDQAVSEANQETKREIRFKGVKEHGTAVESTSATSGGGGIKVWGIAEAGAKGSEESKNSTVSRVSFGIDIGEYTKQEKAAQSQMIAQQFRPRLDNPGR